MILQLMIRRPDEELEQSIVVGLYQSEQTCIYSIKSLLDDKVTKPIANLCFSFLPEGFVIEGVAYGLVGEEPLDAYDLYLKVLH